MKKKLLIATSLLMFLSVVISTTNTSNASSSNPVNGVAGAPMDAGGATCAGSACHSGTATQTTGVIFSDIPGSGFVGGTTYNFTVSMSGASAYGFEMTPQTATSSAAVGTWSAGVGTTVSTKYIKQSTKKTGTTATWTFKWIAPTTATTVTFYGAFNYANNNNTTSGDVIKTSSVTYLANTTGIKESSSSPQTISVFPNPTTDKISILTSGKITSGYITSIDGKLVKQISENELIDKSVIVSDLQKGVYFLNISANQKNLSVRFIKE